jgi:glycosyltransferase involved in cell wall biosynthesis
MRIAVLVSNDLSFDQRVKKTCNVLEQAGHTPILVGRELPNSIPYEGPGTATRFRLKHHRGILFYIELHRTLTKWLKSADIDAIWANDLDTLLPAVLVGRKRGLPVVYDSHEFFTEAAGLTDAPMKRWVWLQVERFTVPKVGAMLTVNESIATKFRERYSVKVDVLRNMPILSEVPQVSPRMPFAEYGVPTDLPILLLQGAFMDRDRGTSDAVEAMADITDARLVLVGAGIEWEESVTRVDDPRWKGRLFCIPRQPYEKLKVLTAAADVGLSLDKALHVNYSLSLPNKLFDFIHVGLPIVASPMVEVKKIVEENCVGVVLNEVSTSEISRGVSEVLASPRSQWSEACMKAREKLHWGVDSHLITQYLEEASSQPWVVH